MTIDLAAGSDRQRLTDTMAASTTESVRLHKWIVRKLEKPDIVSADLETILDEALAHLQAHTAANGIWSEAIADALDSAWNTDDEYTADMVLRLEHGRTAAESSASNLHLLVLKATKRVLDAHTRQWDAFAVWVASLPHRDKP